MIVLNTTDLQEVNGGGPIADLVEAFLCGLIDAQDPSNPWPYYG